MSTKSIFYSLILLLLSAIGSASTAAAQDAQERHMEYMGQIGYGDRVAVELTPEVVAHVWAFDGGEGDPISIVMNALDEELDPYLLLLSMSDGELDEFLSLSDDELEVLAAVAQEFGVLLADNDDRGQDTNALIPSFVLPADGRYFIVTTSCCTAGSWGPYELLLDFGGGEGPPAPAPIFPELHGYFPREGQAGSELILTLEGERFSEIGPLVGVVIGGLEIPVLDVGIISDQILEMAILIPEEASPGEQEISFFFENAGFDGPFFVAEPGIGPGEPVDPVDPGGPGEPVDPGGPGEPVDPVGPVGAGDPGGPGEPLDPGGQPPAIVPPGPPRRPIVYIVLVLLLGAGGVIVWRRVRPPTSPAPPTEMPAEPPLPPPDVRFELDRDAGRQSIEFAGGSLTVDIDIRFRLRIEQSSQDVIEDYLTLIG